MTAEENTMTSRDVLDCYGLLEAAGIAVWVDGGWGVDALLGEQTRPHRDLDIAVDQKHVPRLCALLGERGYREIRRDSPWIFVLGDDAGRKIDVHAFVMDGKGDVVEGVPYPAPSLTGTGTLGGRAVKCISAEYAVRFHAAYEPAEKDRRDVAALCERFKIELPDSYRRQGGPG